MMLFSYINKTFDLNERQEIYYNAGLLVNEKFLIRHIYILIENVNVSLFLIECIF